MIRSTCRWAIRETLPMPRTTVIAGFSSQLMPQGLLQAARQSRAKPQSRKEQKMRNDMLSLSTRITEVRMGGLDLARRPRVLCLDWLDPLRNTGQWIPQLVSFAGGEEGLAILGGLSRELSWDEITTYAPEFLMVMPCGFDPERVRLETTENLMTLKGWNELPAVQMEQVFLFDGRVPTRHGPRVVDVLEGLAEAMHPQRFGGISNGEVLTKNWKAPRF